MKKYIFLVIFGLVGCIITGAYASPQIKKQVSTEQSDILSAYQVSDELVIPGGLSYDMIHSVHGFYWNELTQTDTYLERSEKWIRERNYQVRNKSLQNLKESPIFPPLK